MTRHLYTPGPVDVPFSVRMAAAGPMISHRGEEWSDLLEEVKGRLGRLLGVEEPVVLLPGSGTGALEALAANLLASGGEVISFSCGTFGDRFREIVSRRGAKVIALDAPRGEGFRRAHVREALERHPGADALLFTHHETSTGVVNPLEELLSEVPADGPLVLVDAVSSLGAMPCRPSKWGVDGLASCSQKGLLAPPGLAVVYLSERGWERTKRDACPSYFFDLALHRRFLNKSRPQNPFTPPVSVFYGLAESLRFLEGFGWGPWFNRTRRKARSFEAACEGMGLELFVGEQEFRSPVMTALEIPAGKERPVKQALEEMGITVAEGQGREGGTLRIAHYNPGGWPEVCLLAGGVFGAARKCGIDARDGFLEKALQTWNRGGKKSC